MMRSFCGLDDLLVLVTEECLRGRSWTCSRDLWSLG